MIGGPDRYFHAGAVSQFDNDSNTFKDKMINLIYGFTGTLKVSKHLFKRRHLKLDAYETI
jgi:hypothetical protein